MIDFLTEKFIIKGENISDTKRRTAYGFICGLMGICFNILLFIIKLSAGVISGSVAAIADAFNNLSDAGSSVIMMIGFKMAGKKPDPDHPFGHGRIEYVTGLIVSIFIILMGVELVESSIKEILSPSDVKFTPIVAGIMFASVLVKLYMYYYNSRTAAKISSVAMKSTAMDSLSDCLATLVVLASMIVGYLTGLHIDGLSSLIVSAFILYAGISSAKDTLAPLLGTKPDAEYVKAIEKFVVSTPGIIGMHDLVVHDYGPGRQMISLHAEVPANCNIVDAHDTIDVMEAKLNMTLGCHATIHMDPIVVDDEMNDRMKRLCYLIAKSVDENFTIHDFRMVKGNTHTNLIFDVVAPYTCPLNEEEIKEQIQTKVTQLPGNHFAVVKVDRPYV